MNSTFKDDIIKLYNDGSKHAIYQNLPEFVQNDLDYNVTINEEWRGDTARLKYINQKLDFSTISSIADIGANTGFFILSLAHLYKNIQCLALEGNSNHSKLIKNIVDNYQLPNVKIINEYIVEESVDLHKKNDLVIFLNVLHHAGYEFDKYLNKDPKKFRHYAINFLSKMRKNTGKMIFQMGSNMGGDISNPIIGRNDDAEKILFISNIFTASGWKVIDVSFPSKTINDIDYLSLDFNIVQKINTEKVDENDFFNFLELCKPGELKGEFYRRPIFIVENNDY